MPVDVYVLLLAILVAAFAAHEGEQQARKNDDKLPGAGVSFLGLGSMLVILISLAHIIVRILSGS